MRLPMTSLQRRASLLRQIAECHANDATLHATCVTEMRNLMRVFFLTIFFRDSIQRTNCDEVMSQYSISDGKGE